MKRSDLLNEVRDLLRVHLLESGNIVNTARLADEMISVTEKYMIPKPTRKLLDTPDGDIPVTVNQWE